MSKTRSTGARSRSPMDLIQANAAANAVKHQTPTAFHVDDFKIMLGKRNAKGAQPDAPTGSMTVSGTLMYFRYGPDNKVARVVMHELGQTMVLSDYRTGYRLCDVDYAIGYRATGQTPTDLRAAHDTFTAFLERHTAAAYELALSKLKTANEG